MNEYFSTRFKPDKNRGKVWAEICRYLQKYIPDGAAVIDIGSGYCDFINNICAAEKHAVDINAEASAHAGKDVVFHAVSSMRMPNVKSNHFDVAFCSNVFEHLSDEELEQTLSEIRRILKPRGVLIALQPNFRYSVQNYFDDYTHKKIFTDVSLKDCLEAKGFEVIVNVPRFLPLSFKSKVPKSAFLTRLYLLLPFKPFAKQMLLVARNLQN